MKESIADKVVESLNDTILEEIEHYMFMSGKYEETDRLYMSDQREIFKIVAKKLIKK